MTWTTYTWYLNRWLASGYRWWILRVSEVVWFCLRRTRLKKSKLVFAMVQNVTNYVTNYLNIPLNWSLTVSESRFHKNGFIWATKVWQIKYFTSDSKTKNFIGRKKRLETGETSANRSIRTWHVYMRDSRASLMQIQETWSILNRLPRSWTSNKILTDWNVFKERIKNHPTPFERSETVGHLSKLASIPLPTRKTCKSFLFCSSVGLSRQQYKTTNKLCSRAVNNSITQGTQSLTQTI